jgi:hypothetical protein
MGVRVDSQLKGRLSASLYPPIQRSDQFTAGKIFTMRIDCLLEAARRESVSAICLTRILVGSAVRMVFHEVKLDRTPLFFGFE